MAQADFLQGEIAERFMPETDVEGLRDTEAVVALGYVVVTTVVIISLAVFFCVVN